MICGETYFGTLNERLSIWAGVERLGLRAYIKEN